MPTSTPTTFSDLYSDLLNRVRATLGTTAATTTQTNYAKRYINMANHDLHIQQNWWWAERRDIILTHNDYITGSVSIASTARTTLEGSNTAWNSTVSGMGFANMRALGKLTFAGEQDVYIVSAVTSATAATLQTRYVGGQTTATAYALAYASYTYYEDEYAVATDYFRLMDTRFFSSDLDIPIIPNAEFYRLYPRNNTTGRPKVATIIEIGPGTTVSLRPRVMFHPAPDAVYQIPYRYITSNLSVSSDGSTAPNLSADADEPIVPVRYRHVLVFYALAQWYRDLKADSRAAEVEAQYVDMVRRIANDSTPERNHPRLQPRRYQYLAQTAGPFRRGRGRYSADTRFDEIRDAGFVSTSVDGLLGNTIPGSGVACKSDRIGHPGKPSWRFP